MPKKQKVSAGIPDPTEGVTTTADAADAAKRARKTPQKNEKKAGAKEETTINPAQLPPVPRKKGTPKQQQPEQEQELQVAVGGTIGTTAAGGSLAVPNFLGSLSAKKKKAEALHRRIKGKPDDTTKFIDFDSVEDDTEPKSSEDQSIDSDEFLDAQSRRLTEFRTRVLDGPRGPTRLQYRVPRMMI